MVRHPSKRRFFRVMHGAGLVAAFVALLAGQHLATAQSTSADTALAQTPLFVSESYPPLNMLVMGRDHKLYYEAYNDASDLDGDGRAVLTLAEEIWRAAKPDEIGRASCRERVFRVV